MTRVYADIWWALLLMTVIQAIGMLGLLALLTDRNRPTVGEALATGAKYFLPYLGSQLLISLILVLIIMVPVAVGGAAGIGAGLLVGVLALAVVVYLLTKFSLTIPVIVIERVMNPVRALGRSWRLTKGNSLRLFLFYFLLFIALIVITMVIGIVVAVLGVLTGPDGALFISGLVNALVNMVGVVLLLAVVAAIHRQLAGQTDASETFE